MGINKKANWNRNIILFLIVITVLRLIIGAKLNLTDDEAYYWTWSNSLGISYYDHPPMIAYMIRFFTNIFGNTNLAVRMVGTLSITFSSYIIYKIVEKLYNDQKLGFFTAVVLNIVPLFAMGGLMSLPDSPLILFYTMSLYVFIKIIYDKQEKMWYLLGILTGLGILSKYNMFMVYPAVFFYLIFDKEERYWFKKKEPYIAFIISMIMLMPIIIWNVQNDWVSFTFHLYERQSKTRELRLDYFTQYIVSQLLLITPIIFVGMFTASFKNFKKKDVKLLFFYGLPIFGIFLVSSLFNQFKLHWAILSYIPFMIIYMKYSKFNRKLKLGGEIFATLLSALIYLHVMFLILPLPPKGDIVADMYGWDLIGKEVQELYNDLDKEEWFIYSNRYQLSSQLAFYLPEKEYVYSLNPRLEQFDFWKDSNELIGKNAIFVNNTFYKNPPDRYSNFEKIELEKSIDIVKKGKIYRTYFIYKCFNYKGEK